MVYQLLWGTVDKYDGEMCALRPETINKFVSNPFDSSIYIWFGSSTSNRYRHVTTKITISMINYNGISFKFYIILVIIIVLLGYQ